MSFLTHLECSVPCGAPPRDPRQPTHLCTCGMPLVARYDLAAADLEKSVELAGAADGCSCEPYDSLAYLYIDATGQHDKGRDLLRRARGSGHRIAREYVERLERSSP